MVKYLKKVNRNGETVKTMKYGERSQKEIRNFFNWDFRAIHRYYGKITDELKETFKSYFKALNLDNIIISDYNNGDLRIIDNNGTYPLYKLFDMFNIEYGIVLEKGSKKTYRLKVFYD